MSEFAPITDMETLNKQDEAEMVAGYMAGRENAPVPGSDKSRAFAHGWRNGMVDFKHATGTEAQAQLAREYVKFHDGNIFPRLQ